MSAATLEVPDLGSCGTDYRRTAVKGYQTQWPSLGYFFLGGGGSVPEFHLALAKPIQVRPKTSPPPGPLPSLILLILSLLPLILSTSRKSSSSTLTRGSLRDCLPPVAPRLSDVIEGELPALCAVSAGFPQGPPVWIHLPRLPLIHAARAPVLSSLGFSTRPFLISVDESWQLLPRRPRNRGDIRGNRQSSGPSVRRDPAGFLCARPRNWPECQR